MSDDYLADAGDLVWTDFDPTLGREQRGRRPALVLSPQALARNTGFVIVAPITSRVRPFPTSVVLPKGSAIEGEVLLNQIRSIDALARPVKFAGRVGDEVAREVREKVGMLIGI